MSNMLKARHSLKGKNLLPHALKLRAMDSPPDVFLRFGKNLNTEAMNIEELKQHLEKLCDQEVEDIISIAGKRVDAVESWRYLAHLAISLANESGAPKASTLTQPLPSTSEDVPKGQKRPAEEPIQDKMTVMEAEIKKLKEKDVRETNNSYPQALSETSIPTVNESSWEFTSKFDPEWADRHRRTTMRWVDYKGETLNSSAQRNSIVETVSLEHVSEKSSCIKDLYFRDNAWFISSNLRNHIEEWSAISTHSPDGHTVCNWLREGVNVHSLFTPFKGDFQGRHIDSKSPLPACFSNAKSCIAFEEFIARSLEESIINGSVRLLGRVGEVTPPTIVMPLTVEPTKPRLCHDERYLNLWIKDTPVKLDTLKDIPRLVPPGAYMCTVDDKNGYHHIPLSDDSQTYFGIRFAGWYMVYTVIPFCFRASAYIYQTTGMVATSYLRDLGIPLLQYIDDRFIAPYSGPNYTERSSKDNTRLAIYMTCSLLIRLGYFLSIEKSILEPAKRLKWLGFEIDSLSQAFILPQEKKDKFALLREHIKEQPLLSVKTLQRFSGKCISFMLAVPAAKLYTREVNIAISKGIKNSKPIPLSCELKAEICYWRFLDTSTQIWPWVREHHLQLTLATDASSYKWGAVIKSCRGNADQHLGDFWRENDQDPIHLKEARALLLTLRLVVHRVKHHRVDAFVDNQAVVSAWENQGYRNRPLTEIMKSIFELNLANNIHLRLFYIPSKNNPADVPSRTLNKSDSTLSSETWESVERAYGPHR